MSGKIVWYEAKHCPNLLDLAVILKVLNYISGPQRNMEKKLLCQIHINGVVK